MSLPTLLAIVLAPLAAVWLLPLLSDVTSLVRRLGPARPRPALAGGSTSPRLLFLIPAHNESLLIEPCVRSLLAMENRSSRSDVCVVADNCDDDTAAVARAAGATVLERRDPSRRGKPFAIEWAMGRSRLADYDAVVIIDADSVVDPGFADALAGHAPLRDVAVQAYFGLSNEGDSWLSQLAGLLVKTRYEGQYRHKSAAGLSVPLTGNGMCLGTGLLSRVGWPNDSLTENWEMYARCVERGETVRFAPAARLYSQSARTLKQSNTQRRRWQAGRRHVLRDHWRRIVGSRVTGLRQQLDAVGELAVPGPVLHATLATAAALLLALLPGSFPHVVAAAFLFSTIPIVVWTTVVLLRQPNRAELLLAMLRLPVYAPWRLFVAGLAYTTGRRAGWHRSPRHAAGEPDAPVAPVAAPPNPLPDSLLAKRGAVSAER